MDPRDFLSVAAKLVAGPNPSPADCRTVIGRSYYAALNVVAAIVDELNIPRDKSKESHKEVTDLVANSHDRNLKAACDSIANQKMLRNRADYDMSNRDVETVQKASMALLLAKDAIRKVDGVRLNPDQWRVATHNIVEYARNIQKKVF
jgi:hypothetical protein